MDKEVFEDGYVKTYFENGKLKTRVPMYKWNKRRGDGVL